MVSKINFQENQIIFKEGAEGDAAYLVTSGEVWLYQGSGPSRTILDIKYKGQIFGELALFDNAPRFASAEAKTKVSCIAVCKEEFRELLAKGNNDPIMKSLIRSMKEHKLK
ncbi:MAG: cyclic nucleotide-binding domain-containing protein [Rickettsiales bacterium]|jgi:CRP-like cAMP-binding protein